MIEYISSDLSFPSFTAYRMDELYYASLGFIQVRSSKQACVLQNLNFFIRSEKIFRSENLLP